MFTFILQHGRLCNLIYKEICHELQALRKRQLVQKRFRERKAESQIQGLREKPAEGDERRTDRTKEKAVVSLFMRWAGPRCVFLPMFSKCPSRRYRYGQRIWQTPLPKSGRKSRRSKLTECGAAFKKTRKLWLLEAFDRVGGRPVVWVAGRLRYCNGTETLRQVAASKEPYIPYRRPGRVFRRSSEGTALCRKEAHAGNRIRQFQSPASIGAFYPKSESRVPIRSFRKQCYRASALYPKRRCIRKRKE